MEPVLVGQVPMTETSVSDQVAEAIIAVGALGSSETPLPQANVVPVYRINVDDDSGDEKEKLIAEGIAAPNERTGTVAAEPEGSTLLRQEPEVNIEEGTS